MGIALNQVVRRWVWKMKTIPPKLPKYAESLIKKADRASAFLEARQLAGFEEAEANRYFGRHKDIERIRLRALPPDEAQSKFLDRFQTLYDAMHF